MCVCVCAEHAALCGLTFLICNLHICKAKSRDSWPGVLFEVGFIKSCLDKAGAWDLHLDTS